MKALFVGGHVVGQHEIGPELQTIVDVAELPEPSSYLLGQVPNVVMSTTVRYTLRRSTAITLTSRWRLDYYAPMELNDEEAHGALIDLMWSMIGAYKQTEVTLGE
jgi:hypothetical protein